MAKLFFAPIHSSSLAAYRIFFGLLNAIGLVRFWYLGWIERCFIEPQYFFKYYGFSWVEVWPGQGIYIHFALLILVCVFLSLGLFTRLMSFLFFIGFTYIELLDQSNYLNHYYLISLLGFINIFLPLSARWSLDNKFGFTQFSEFVPAWTLGLLRAQIGTVYFFAGLAKVGSDWLLQAQPLNIWLTALTDMPVLGWAFAQTWSHFAMSWMGFLFDISIVFWLLNARTRPFAYAVVVVFHLATYALFPIGMFPFIMMFSALVFFPPDWPMRWVGKSESDYFPSNIRFQFRPAIIVSVFFYMAVQWALPLRHHLYPGDELWSEEGMRFAWKVMIREKNSEAVFRVQDLDSNQIWYVSGSQYLMRHQELEMSNTPDMLLEFAHFLKAEFAKRGKRVAVFAETMTSFNGRRAQPLVDPNVDLSQERDSLWPKKWIRPAPHEEPSLISFQAPK